MILPNYIYSIGYFGHVVSLYALHFLDEPAPLPTKFCSDLHGFRRHDEINFFRLHFLLQKSSGRSIL